MSDRRALIVAVSLAFAPALAAAQANGPSLPALRAHLDFLADDLLAGRDTGSRGHDIAAHYAATRFAEYGLQPGAGGSFLQPIGFAVIQLEKSTLEVVEGGAARRLEWKSDYLIQTSAHHPKVELRAPVVFVGYGIDAAELGHRDYEGIDVRGKIVLTLSGAPESFPNTQRAHHSSRRLKAEVAAAHGAVGVLVIRTRVDAGRVPWERMTLNAGKPSFAWKHPDERIEGGPPELQFGAMLSEAGAQRLLADSGATLEELLDGAESLDYRRRQLGVFLRVRARSTLSEVSSPNVVAVLPGADPELGGEHVVVSAHLDHVGVGAAVDGDEIYNGFFDNAMGSAILLETARLLAAAPEPPRRSVIFLLVTGEEKGLLGSEYFAAYPTVPVASIVADVNIDMPLLLGPVAELIAFGAEHSSLGELAERAADAAGFALAPDPAPEEVIFVRSDQYSFVRHGVPAIYLNPGIGTRGGGDRQANAIALFRRQHYHRPSDEIELGADWESVLRFTAANADLIARIADDDERPVWNEGDFFGVTFGGGR
jgi:hypothetical protein